MGQNKCASLVDEFPLFEGGEELKGLIEKSEVVSFDFFDTLFVRPLANPEDVFDILGCQFSIPNFRELRKAAQAEAFRRMHVVGRKEINLNDIYSCLADSGLPTSELMLAEYNLELTLVEPNPEIFSLFCELIKQGKSVVITSDMYFSKKFFLEALHPYDLSDTPLFVSADCNATKRDDGELFDVVVAELGVVASQILHIGDNALADVTRPRQKGLRAFHYCAEKDVDIDKNVSLSTSISHGLLRTRARDIPRNSYAELGFIYGGSAALGFLNWIKERAQFDNIDKVLFLSRDGFVLERIAKFQADAELPDYSYFYGSRTAFTLASITDENFLQFMPFFLSGSDGLSPCELLERIGVESPSARIMEDMGLGDGICVTPALHEKLMSFFFAYRWKILKVCQRNRRALYFYLKQMGLDDGKRVALVDVGWSGTSQESFELAVLPLMNLDVYGYYFCLADTPERARRESKQRMFAMVNAENTCTSTIAKIYDNRVIAELFFSAPHSSVIGMQIGTDGVQPILDSGRGDTDGLAGISEELGQGVDAFVEHYDGLQKRLGLSESPLNIALPLIELLVEDLQHMPTLLSEIKNFDAWGSSRKKVLTLADYL